jgi:hypothetical protein
MKTRPATIAAAILIFSSLGGASSNPVRAAEKELQKPAQSGQAGNADFAARLDALEAKLKDSGPRPSTPVASGGSTGGWWTNTSISGRMYYDVTNISNTANGARSPGAGNGTSFDIKRFYVGIDHTFNSMFSANVTTDTVYDSGSSTGQIYLKKAYLQAKVDPLLTVRAGAADLPWIPYVEGIYGMRYFEQTLVDRTKFGSSSDWGIHALGTAFNGILSYDFAMINGGGYKKIPSGGGTNRSHSFDYEGRISAGYQGFNLAVGGYSGKLGTSFGTPAFHTAQRFDLLGGYVADGLRLGVEYFNASNYSAALVASPSAGDSAHGVSSFGSYYFLPQWAVFTRYDSVDTNTKTAHGKNNEYYTLGVAWSPAKIVDVSLAYKHDAMAGGTFTDANGTIGSAAGAKRGAYNELGIWGDFQW